MTQVLTGGDNNETAELTTPAYVERSGSVSVAAGATETLVENARLEGRKIVTIMLVTGSGSTFSAELQRKKAAEASPFVSDMIATDAAGSNGFTEYNNSGSGWEGGYYSLKVTNGGAAALTCRYFVKERP